MERTKGGDTYTAVPYVDGKIGKEIVDDILL